MGKQRTKFIHTTDFDTATRLLDQGVQLVLQDNNHWTFLDDELSPVMFSKEDKIVKSNMLYM